MSKNQSISISGSQIYKSYYHEDENHEIMILSRRLEYLDQLNNPVFPHFKYQDVSNRDLVLESLKSIHELLEPNEYYDKKEKKSSEEF